MMYHRKQPYRQSHSKVSTPALCTFTPRARLSLEDEEEEEQEQQPMTLATSDTIDVADPADSTCTAESIEETSPSHDHHNDDEDDNASADTEDPDQHETQDGSDDDLHDLPSDFDDDHAFLDDSFDNNGDVECLRSATKNLMSSLSEMQAASTETDRKRGPHSLLYGDDYVVSMKNRRFALAFLEYTQLRVDKQRNPEKFRLLASLKKSPLQKKPDDTSSPLPRAVATALVPAMTTTATKKKRNKRNKKKKPTNTSDVIGSVIRRTRSMRGWILSFRSTCTDAGVHSG